MVPLFSFINIQKYSLKLASSLATILVKTNTLGGENKHFKPMKVTAEEFFFCSLSPVNIKPLFLEKKEQIKHRILISQLHVSSNGRLESVFGGSLMLVFLSEKNCIRPKEMPLRFNYLPALFFPTDTYSFIVLLCWKNVLVDVFCVPNGKGNITSKMECSAFCVFDKRGWVLWIISRWHKCLWSRWVWKRAGIWKLGYCPFRCLILFASVFRSILIGGNTSCMHLGYSKESSFL